MATTKGKCVLAYAVCAMFTAAWVYDGDWSAKNSNGEPKWDDADRKFIPILIGAAWPLYWSAKGALYIVRSGKAAWQNQGCEVKVPS